MISDEDVKRFFRSQLGKPCVYGGGKGALQIRVGQPKRLWKDAPLGSCTRHMKIFHTFRVIPEYCFECYKVQITPRNVVELFKLLMVFEKIKLPDDNTRKCMVERREYCAGAYKDYIYSKGIEEANEIKHIVQDASSNDISPEVKITVKRGCSEFADAYPAFSSVEPNSTLMEYNKDWKVHEEFIDKNSTYHPINYNTPASENKSYSPAEIFAMRYWLGYAATIGDLSYLKITGCPLPPIPDLQRPPFTAPPNA